MKIGIIVILYKSDKVDVADKVSGDNAILIVVDNTPDQDLRLGNGNNYIYLSLKENLGIAEAQNRGIRVAIEQKCSHVVFFDQDSIVEEDYTNKIVEEYIRIENFVPNLFLLGPTIINGRNKREYKSTIHKDKRSEFDFTPRREIISSGSCVSIEKIKKVGLLENRLFIDYVDFEWCWRANSLGFQSGITSKISLTHFVGQEDLYLCGQLIIISSPVRYYFQIRNYLWLLKDHHTPFSWKLNSGIKKAIYSPIILCKIRNRGDYIRNLWRGIVDGIKMNHNEKD